MLRVRVSLLLLVLLGAIPASRAAAKPAGTGDSTSSGLLLLVDNKGEHTLGIVDPASGQQLAKVTESGITGHEVIASPDGKRAYVPIYGNSGVGSPGTDGSTVDVIDVPSRKLVTTIDLGRGQRPHCPIFNPRDGLLYVTTEITNRVTIIDPKTNKVVGSIPTEQPESHMLAITHDGRRGYTSNVGPGTVSVLDLEHRKPITVIHVSPDSQRIALSRDDKMAFTADQKSPRLAVIDTAANQVKTWIPLPGVAYGTAATRDGRWLLAALIRTNQVGVIDLQQMKVVRTIDVPKAPQEILMALDGQTAYVSCDASHQIAAINLSTWKVEKLIDVGKGADGLAWAR
jgi:YVTN family beta-propeller protein